MFQFARDVFGKFLLDMFAKMMYNTLGLREFHASANKIRSDHPVNRSKKNLVKWAKKAYNGSGKVW